MAKVVCPFCFQKVPVKPGECCPGKSAKGSKLVEECLSAKNKIPLPPEVFTHQLFPIIVVGGKDAGKTVYLTSMARELAGGKRWNYWEVNLVDYKGNPFETIMEDMFQNNQFPGMTKAIHEHPPLLLSLRKSRPWWWPRPLPMKKPLLLCFTDPAGEHFGLSAANRGELLQKYPVLKGHAKAAIAVMDPMEVNQEWENLLLPHRGLDKGAVAGNARVADSLMALAMMRGHSELPVAVCMTKLDETVGAHSPLNADINNKKGFELAGVFRMNDTGSDTYLREPGYFSWRDMLAEDRIMRKKLFDMSSYAMFNSLGITLPRLGEPADGLWSEHTLKKAAFKYHAFFGVSATGLGHTRRKLDGTPGLELDGIPVPFRVMDPVLWILWQYGLLGSAKLRTT